MGGGPAEREQPEDGRGGAPTRWRREVEDVEGASVIAQKILPAAKEEVGLVPVQEILIGNPTVQKLIAEGEDKKLEQVIRGGKEDGM
ncbi:MAG TPA: hypothetical protein PLA46_04600, partial [Phycicoccus sp.]|nr:hypothetical protein [Phycicoccus sp.]